MADIKVTVELEISDKFRPCENDIQIYDQYECPFAYYHYDDGCQVCGYGAEYCPMKNMKLVK